MTNYAVLIFGCIEIDVISSRSIYKKLITLSLNLGRRNLTTNQSLNQANLTKFLGVYVDEHLT